MHYIYCITNKNNNKSYVGQTENLKGRWYNHRYDGKKLRKGRSHAFQNALHKYGNDGFTWQVIETHDNLDDTNEAEEFFIDYLDTLVPNGYNIKRGGNNHKPSEETKKKISATHKSRGTKPPSQLGVAQSEKNKKHLSELFSGDGAAMKKINSQTAKIIYLEYYNNIENITMEYLTNKYNLAIRTIADILHKITWKDATKDLPDINFDDPKYKMKNIKNPFSDDEVRTIRKDFATTSLKQGAFIRITAQKYDAKRSGIYNIVKNISYKNVVL